MKKFSRILSIVCMLCMIVNIIVLPSGTANAAISESRIVHICNMWNSNYMINEAGIGKYSAANSDGSSVWTITPYDSSSYTIRNWDGTYLCASENSVICQEISSNDDSFLWKLINAEGEKYWIESVSQTGKAINIENLTGSLQLTNYYDTWESAKWIIDDTSTPEFQIGADNVIFRSVDQQTYMYCGDYVGTMSVMHASINDGNFLYRIIDKGDYCYIQYNPANGTSGYLKAEYGAYSLNSILDEESVNYRWNIQKNNDGTVSIVSVACEGMCISNTGMLVNIADGGDAVKWNMYSANSLTIRICDISNTHFLSINNNSDNRVIFKYYGEDASYGLESEWQVIYNDGKMYLKNRLTGKYLRAGENDENVYVSDYAADKDEQFSWRAFYIVYGSGLENKNCSLHIGGPIDLTGDDDLYAYMSEGVSYYYSMISFKVVGFMQ